MQRLRFDRHFNLPPDRVFAFLSEHENLSGILGARVTRISDGTDGTRNGVGSARRLKFGPAPPFEETVTACVPDELIDYRITKGSPLEGHSGEMRFSPAGSGTHLTWIISFDAKIPGLAFIVAQGLKYNIGKSLARVDSAA